jgi:UDP-N-acetylglucosamine--N-acetylmuramyl-(pentapeptide) pyrophosphoryl-undecaprenol N-acetylglucosamine transferase
VRAGYAGLTDGAESVVDVRAEAYLDPVAPELQAATLVVCRAGATTLAELAAAGRPAVLIPFPAATDDHQRRNAQALVAAGAAEMLEERALSGDRLADVMGRLLDDANRRAAMAEAMRKMARPAAARDIVTRVRELAGVSA